jgi:hypothetical protein
MVGVVTVTSTRAGVYGQHTLVLDRLHELGARSIRSRLYTGNSGQLSWLRTLAAEGVRANLVMGDPLMESGTPEQLVSLVASQLPGVASSFEGANEWNLSGRGGWANELRSHQARLYRAAKGNVATASIPVVAPALGRREGYSTLGDLSEYLDLGNMHLYTGGFTPGYRSDAELANAAVVCGSKPVVVSETGWHNASASTATHHYTPEDVAGSYAPRLFLEYFVRRVPRVFVFELVDEPADPSMTDHEAHFGLLRSDFSRKPAYIAIRNLLALVTASRVGSSGPSSLTYGVEGATSDLQQALVRRPDGSFVLFLWRRAPIWDPVRRRALPVTPVALALDWAMPCDVRRYEPSFAESAQSTQLGVTKTLISVGSDVVALDILRR